MPKSAGYTLTWSSSSQAYALYEGQGEEALNLALDSPAWSLRVSQLASFAFHGHNGSYTAARGIAHLRVAKGMSTMASASQR